MELAATAARGARGEVQSAAAVPLPVPPAAAGAPLAGPPCIPVGWAYVTLL